MKPDKRGERRAQFVAGIGDEVGAHFLDAAQRREIVKCHQHQIGPVQAGLALDRHHDGLEPAVERAALGIVDALLFAARRGAADRLDQFGHAQRQRHRLALPQRRRQGARVLVERQHPAVAVERDDRIGQAGDHGAERIVGALGDGDRLRQAIVLVAGAQRQQRRRRDDGETCERIDGSKRAGQRQARRIRLPPSTMTSRTPRRSPSDRRRPISSAHQRAPISGRVVSWRRIGGARASARGTAEQASRIPRIASEITNGIM